MKKLVWILLLIASVAQLQCTQSTPAAQPDCGFVQNSDGQRVSWNGLLPVKVYYDTSVPTQYYQDIQNAANTWQAALGQQAFDLAGVLPSGSPAIGNPGQDGLNVIYWLSNWGNQPSNQQANTTIYWVDNAITEADVRVNAQNFTFSDGSVTNPSSVDVQSLLLHELGHILGLKHDDTTPSVMATYLQTGTLRRTLLDADMSHIQCEY